MKKLQYYVIFSFLMFALNHIFSAYGYEKYADLIYLLAPLSAFVVGIFVIEKYKVKNIQGVSLLFLVLGMLTFCLGELIWSYLYYIKGVEPYPSIADIFFIGVYPVSLIGLILKIKMEKIKWSYDFVQKFCPFIILLLILTGLVFYFGIYNAYVPGDDLPTNLISMFYGIGDLILIFACFLVLVITIEYKGGKMFFPWILITLSYSVLLVADVIFSANKDVYETNIPLGIIIDSIWMAGYFIFGMAMSFFLDIIEGHERNILAKLKQEKNNGK